MKKILIIVDCQNDFISGSLGYNSAESIVKNIAARAKMYYNNGDEIVFTADTHDEKYHNSRQGRRLPVTHCLSDTFGQKIHLSLNKYLYDAKIFYKSTFASISLYEYLKSGGYDEVELAGFVTEICVISNAVMALTALPDAEISVYRNCVGTDDEKMNTAALDVMRRLHINIKE